MNVSVFTRWWWWWSSSSSSSSVPWIVMCSHWILKSGSSIILPFWIFIWKGSTMIHRPWWPIQKIWVNLSCVSCFLANCFVIFVLNNCFWCWTLRKVGCDSCLYVTCKFIFRKGYHAPWSVIDLGNYFSHILQSFRTTCWNTNNIPIFTRFSWSSFLQVILHRSLVLVEMSEPFVHCSVTHGLVLLHFSNHFVNWICLF